MTAPPPQRSVVMARLGGVEVPLKSVPQCHTCMHPRRLLIEQTICSGGSYARLAVENEDDDSFPSVEAMREHFARGHVPRKAMVKRAVMEKHFADLGEDLAGVAVEQVNFFGAAKLLLAEGVQRVMDGTIEMKAGDLLGVIKVLAEFEDMFGNGGIDEAMWVEALLAYNNIIMPHLPPEKRSQISFELGRNPVIKRLLELEQEREQQGALP